MPKTCDVDACGKSSYCRSMCSRHYRHWLATGERGGVIRESYATPEESFAARTERRGDCLVWTGALAPSGYGALRLGAKTETAHRYAWERKYGPIPKGAVIDHSCHNRACVSVDHLRLATPAQNSANRSVVTAASGYRNVYFDKRRGQYFVSVRHEGRYHSGGRFSELAPAVTAAAGLRDRLNGEFAGLGVAQDNRRQRRILRRNPDA